MHVLQICYSGLLHQTDHGIYEALQIDVQCHLGVYVSLPTCKLHETVLCTLLCEQVHMKLYQGKKYNATIVAKFNELIENISRNNEVVVELKTTLSDLKHHLKIVRKK